NILRLLHPFIPFITEEIWYHLYAYPIDDTTKTIMRTEWPKKQSDLIKPELEDVVDKVQKVVYAIRNIRSEMNIPPTVEIKVILKVDNRELLSILRENQQHITTLGRVDSLEMGARIKKPSWAASAVIKDVEIFVPLEGVVDVEKERARLEKEIVRVADLLTKTNKKLSNEDFLKRAPGEIIEKEETKRGDYEKMIDKLNQNLERIMRW
ncbi:MAG TPA: class I tRNA ligase family protein, partial [candidate division Zixibacteria bacterium]